ncbi:MAG: hypothetical protein QNJ53_06385 [Pleurocapsa sp. MO_192.B19]|nr:hypothetical protein [Pleurocapsa sp. MO_192.B19]
MVVVDDLEQKSGFCRQKWEFLARLADLEGQLKDWKPEGEITSLSAIKVNQPLRLSTARRRIMVNSDRPNQTQIAPKQLPIV